MIPAGLTRQEKIDFVVKNRKDLEYAKKNEVKHTDNYCVVLTNNTAKAIVSNETELNVKVVINTTNFLDSHNDLHVEGIWNKTILENKNIKFLREHKMLLDHVIADKEDLKVYVTNFSFKELGFDFEGNTQALVFEAKIKKERNEFMFEQYRKGYIDNHSAGMRYVKLLLAVNDEDYAAEFEAWEKYFPLVANKEKAEEDGFFWVIKEAKLIEGSAVAIGSNSITPTIEVKNEPSKDARKNIEPQSALDYDYLINNFKLK